MTTCAASDRQAVTAGYGSCWDWVASLPPDPDLPGPEQASKPVQANDSIVAGSGLVGRRFGVLGLAHGGKFSAGDIYQLAQAARKARERHSVVASSTAHEVPQCESERAVMLRSAYAAQRVDRDRNSDGTLETSFDPFGFMDEEEHCPTAEEVLLELGFGGPAQGVERVPERFLHPSQMRGVDVDQFFAVQQELDETRETGSLGYRGLVGPPSRRPSTIVARLVGRMMRKSLPTATSSFERPPSVLDTRTSDLVPAGQESGLVTPTNQVLMTLPVADSRKTSPASSRRSSLRRQECIDVDEDEHEAISSQSVSEDDFEDDEKPVNKQCMVSGGSFVPTVYVTPPPSTVFTPSDSSSGHEVDSIIACLQLATEVYRVQLDEPHSDENHNTADIKADLRRELDKTDRLLQKMRTRLCNARATHAPCDAESLRAVLDDMVGLLQQQQRLYRQAVELAEPSPAHGRQEGGGAGEDASQVVQLPAAWVRGLERRLSTAIRRSVRRELLKAKPSLRKPRHVSSS